MKILFLMHHAESTLWFKRELIEKLLELGGEIHISVPNSEVIKSEIKGNITLHETKIKRRSMNPVSDLKLYFKYKKIINKVKPDVILTAAIKPNIYGNLAASKSKVPVISNVTGLGTTFQKQGSIKFNIVKLLYKKAFKTVEKVIFENIENRNLMIKNNLLMKEKVIVFSGAGVNLEKFFDASKEHSGDTVYFLLVGRIMRDKGINEYMEAAKILNYKHENLKFGIIGMVEDEQLLKEISESDSVSYFGNLKDPREEIKKADCIVLPSYHEGMANTLLEGAAMGKPLIASDISGCREAIDNNITGFLCIPKDSKSLAEKMEKIILMTKEEREKMGEKGRNKMLIEFDRKKVVEKYIEEIISCKIKAGDMLK